MPIYEYTCETCGHSFEHLVLGGSEPSGCPACQGDRICRMLSACGFFSKDGGGQTTASAAGTSGCSGCAATSCAGCGH